MRKLVLRFLNIIYIAIAGVALYTICTRPIFTATVGVDMTPIEIGEKIAPILNSSMSSNESRATVREKEIKDFMTPEKISKAFEPTNGFHMKVEVSVPASKAFEFQNKQIITEVVIDNINAILDKALDVIVPPLRNFILDVTGEYAKAALNDAVTEQIKQLLGEDSTVSYETIEKMYDNIYEVLDKNEPVPLSTLTELIIGEKNEDGSYTAGALSILNENCYRLCNPQPTQESVEEDFDKYYIKNEEGEYVHPTVYSNEDTYYTYVEYTEDDIDINKLESQMTDALNSVPGLVTQGYTEANPSEEEFKASLLSQTYYVKGEDRYNKAVSFDSETQYYVKRDNPYIEISSTDPDVIANPGNYFIKNSEGEYIRATEYIETETYYYFVEYEPVLVTESEFNAELRSTKYLIVVDDNFVPATYWNSTEKYYVLETTINDIDTALTALITQYLLGGEGDSSGESRAISRAEGEQTLQKLSSTEELRKAVKEYVVQFIPFETLAHVEENYGQYVPYALLAVIVLFGLPWALFAILTLIRTIRWGKVWTKPMLLIIFAMPGSVLAFFLAYGINNFLPLFGSRIEALKTISEILSFEIRLGCLISSFLYMGVVVMSIFYGFIAKPFKIRYRFMKILKDHERYKTRIRGEKYYY